MDVLCEQLQPQYEVLLQGVPLYSKRNRKVAEIDVLAINRNYCDVYEVKCSPRIVKARKQLNKIRKHLSKSSLLRHTYFYCGESEQLFKM